MHLTAQLQLPTLSAFHRYVFDEADLAYVKSIAKKPNIAKPEWLNQKDLAEKTYYFNKILIHYRALDGGDLTVMVPSPTRSESKRKVFTLSQMKLEGSQSRNSEGSGRDNLTSMAKSISTALMPRSRKIIN